MAAFYEKWLAGLKGDKMAVWATGVTAAQWTFLADYAPQMGVLPRAVFAGVTFLVCCALYFINPKTRDWLPAEGLPQDFIRDVVSAFLAERLPLLSESLESRALAAVAKAAVAVEAARPVPAPAPGPVAPAPVLPSPPTLPDPNRTLTNDEALAEVLKSLQTTAVLLQNRIHKEEGGA